jgi:hypothetical protein
MRKQLLLLLLLLIVGVNIASVPEVHSLHSKRIGHRVDKPEGKQIIPAANFEEAVPVPLAGSGNLTYADLEGDWSGRMQAPLILVPATGVSFAPIAMSVSKNGDGDWAICCGAHFTIPPGTFGDLSLIITEPDENVFYMYLTVQGSGSSILLVGTVSKDLERVVGPVFSWSPVRQEYIIVGDFRLSRSDRDKGLFKFQPGPG